jgi:predicted dehydrogenase
MEQTIVNWGILGCADIARGHTIPGLLKAGNARLYGIASRSAGPRLDDFSRQFQPDMTYTSYEAMLADPAIDAVYIPLPNGLHAEWAIKAAKAGKHVLCEKPLGISAEEVILMQQAFKDNRVVLMEAFAYRQSPLIQTVKALLDQGEIGELQFIESFFSFRLDDFANVRLNPDLAGGATYDVGCYNIDLIRYLVGGDPVRILATGDIGARSGVDLMTCSILEFANGVRAVAYSSFTSERCEYSLVGTKGVIAVPPLDNINYEGQVDIQVRTSAGTRLVPVICPDNYQLEIEQFGRVVLAGEPPLIDAANSLGNAQVIDQILSQVHS